MSKFGKEMIESAGEALAMAGGGSERARLAPFDAADYLDSDETAAEYLAVSIEDGDPAVVANAVRTIMRARGEAMTDVLDRLIVIAEDRHAAGERARQVERDHSGSAGHQATASAFGPCSARIRMTSAAGLGRL